MRKNRRQVLTGAAATALASLAGNALAAPSLDVELIEGEKEVEAAMREWHRLLGIFSDLEDQFASVAPTSLARSSFLETAPPELVEEYRKLSIGDLAMIHQVAPDHPLAKWDRLAQVHYNAQADEADRIDAERDRLQAAMGVTAAEETANTASDKAHSLARALNDIPANGLAGVIVKLRVQAKWIGDDPKAAEATLASIRSDIARIASVPHLADLQMVEVF